MIVVSLHLDPLVRGKNIGSSQAKLPLSRKLNYCKFKLGVSKKFQKWHSTKVGCLEILNVINIKFAEFIK